MGSFPLAKVHGPWKMFLQDHAAKATEALAPGRRKKNKESLVNLF